MHTEAGEVSHCPRLAVDILILYSFNKIHITLEFGVCSFFCEPLPAWPVLGQETMILILHDS
jgi:hypothetical protein